jgi:hypothetical protein
MYIDDSRSSKMDFKLKIYFSGNLSGRKCWSKIFLATTNLRECREVCSVMSWFPRMEMTMKYFKSKNDLTFVELFIY